MQFHKPIKSLGQVFLKNENIKKKIAAIINDNSCKTLIEIGPGLGAITQHIETKNKEYWVIEVDSKLSHFLKLEYPEINVINLDFLQLDLNHTNLKNKQILLFGNIPYCITTPIFIKFLKTPEFFLSYFMVQKEYYQMLCSPSNSKNYSSFSVLIQTFCKVNKLFNINKSNFFPKPKIDSTFISLEKINKPILEKSEEYFQFLRTCFRMPRKTLLNNLRKKINKQEAENILDEQQLPLNIRPDQISPEKFEIMFLKIFGKHTCK